MGIKVLVKRLVGLAKATGSDPEAKEDCAKVSVIERPHLGKSFDHFLLVSVF